VCHVCLLESTLYFSILFVPIYYWKSSLKKLLEKAPLKPHLSLKAPLESTLEKMPAIAPTLDPALFPGSIQHYAEHRLLYCRPCSTVVLSSRCSSTYAAASYCQRPSAGCYYSTACPWTSLPSAGTSSYHLTIRQHYYSCLLGKVTAVVDAAI
jgi:hypothetical protein